MSTSLLDMTSPEGDGNSQPTTIMDIDDMTFQVNDYNFGSSDFESLEDQFEFEFEVELNNSLGADDNPEQQYMNSSNTHMMHLNRRTHQHSDSLDSVAAIPSMSPVEQAQESDSQDTNPPPQYGSVPQTSEFPPSQNIPFKASSAPPSKALRHMKRRDDSSMESQNTPKKSTRGKGKKKKSPTPEEIGQKRRVHLDKNKLAATKCRQKKKKVISDLQERAMSLENQHIHLRQHVQNQIVEIVDMREQLRHAFQCSNDTMFRDSLISADAKLMSFNEAISAIDNRVAAINSNAIRRSSPDKSSSNGSDASMEPEVGGVPQSRNNSMQSNNSGRSLLHDSGVSDLGTPRGFKSERPEFHAAKATINPEIANQFGPIPCHAPVSDYSHPQMMSNQRIHGQQELFDVEQYNFQAHEIAQAAQPIAFQFNPVLGFSQNTPGQSENLGGLDMLDPVVFITAGGLNGFAPHHMQQ